uniref:Uncharacterized protein n=1 Tax=Glossina brevipalpis TaxID=37001 RepID=A0A1A9WDF9_9MUSC
MKIKAIQENVTNNFFLKAIYVSQLRSFILLSLTIEHDLPSGYGGLIVVQCVVLKGERESKGEEEDKSQFRNCPQTRQRPPLRNIDKKAHSWLVKPSETREKQYNNVENVSQHFLLLLFMAIGILANRLSTLDSYVQCKVSIILMFI